MNPLMQIFNNMGGGNAILMRAVGAMMRGEDPKAFMANLARTNPALSGVDLNDMQSAAQKLCNEKGVDMQTAIQQVTAQVNANK